MVAKQLARRGIRDSRVLEVMESLPREQFVPPGIRGAAYDDRALPIDHGQTISQPFIVAYMTEQMTPTSSHRVLEVGTGSGYQTAVLCRLCGHVYTIERIAPLQAAATARLAVIGCHNVTFAHGDGSVGLAEHAPYDRIIVTAAAPAVLSALLDQLVDGGILIAPVGGERTQTLTRVVRRGDTTSTTPLLTCRFVKLIGADGWSPRVC